MEQEETRELPLEWKSALLLRSYIKTTVAEAVNTITESSPSHFLFEVHTYSMHTIQLNY